MHHVLLLGIPRAPVPPVLPGAEGDRCWYDGSLVTWFDGSAANWITGGSGLAVVWIDGSASTWLDGTSRTIIGSQ